MCQVTFSIGKNFICEVLCDVLDMDICHLILGRPWQFDMGAWYDCCANAYLFDWKGRKMRLLPFPAKSELPTKDKATLFTVSGSSLLSEYKDSSRMFLLLVTE
ncbi:hypothetical protein PanWU01x14_142830 [Parasponia andersonii]|uniref:Uncharacterized protein n=1 Tax=Parasponia andersonii TaxID=3476 RepID=A0A2P5CLJ5_PARAD|nr:hypothetical protein PanWU01x14_142830 [Parasponia andersonii]